MYDVRKIAFKPATCTVIKVTRKQFFTSNGLGFHCIFTKSYPPFCPGHTWHSAQVSQVENWHTDGIL